MTDHDSADRSSLPRPQHADRRPTPAGAERIPSHLRRDRATAQPSEAGERPAPRRSTSSGPAPSRVLAAAASVSAGIGLVALMANAQDPGNIVVEVQPAPVVVQPNTASGTAIPLDVQQGSATAPLDQSGTTALPPVLPATPVETPQPVTVQLPAINVPIQTEPPAVVPAPASAPTPTQAPAPTPRPTPRPTSPPATQPPATQPPATQPPSTQPPATQPPATQPPATQPPVTQSEGS